MQIMRGHKYTGLQMELRRQRLRKSGFIHVDECCGHNPERTVYMSDFQQVPRSPTTNSVVQAVVATRCAGPSTADSGLCGIRLHGS